VVDLGLDGDDWPLEGEVFELELDLELSALEGGRLGSLDEDAPQGVAGLVYHVAPNSHKKYSLVSS
jgi:hypothetical protein